MPKRLRSEVLRIAADLPKGDPTRRELLASLRVAALPKVPGISAKMLALMVERAQENVVEGLTDAYGGHGELGSEWVAYWKSSAIGSQDHNVQGEYYTVTQALFQGATNSGSIEVHSHWDPITSKHRQTADLDMAAQVVADALKGSWAAKTWFGWREHYATVKKVGDTFESNGEEFSRRGVEGFKNEAGFHVNEYPIAIRVSRVNIRKDGSFRVTAKFTA